MTSPRRYVLYSFLIYLTRTLPDNPTLAERFASIIEELRRAVAAHSSKHHDLTPLMMLLWARLGRIDARFQALVARVRAGLPAPAPRKASPSAAPHPQTTRPAASPPRLPQSFAWLVRLMLHVAAVYGSQLQYLLNDPEMPALLAAEPRLGRILRPLCHMLAVRPIPNLPAAPRRAVKRAVAANSAVTPSKTTPSPTTPPPRLCPKRRRSAAIRPAAAAPSFPATRFART